MANVNPDPEPQPVPQEPPAPVVDASLVEADPKKPYKAYAAAFIAVAITIVQVVQAQTADGEWSGEDTTTAVLAFLSAVLVYFVENPKVIKA